MGIEFNNKNMIDLNLGFTLRHKYWTRIKLAGAIVSRSITANETLFTKKYLCDLW